MDREQYPLSLCLASVMMTAAGLSAAAMDVQWGAAPASGNGLRLAWVYVQVMAAATWLLVWPAAALRPSRREVLAVRELLWQVAAMWVGMIPAMVAAGFVSATPVGTVVTALALQAAASGLMVSVLAMLGRWRSPATSAVIVGGLAAVVIGGPIAAFLWRELLTK